MPKLLIINKSTGTGGAAIAAMRLFRAHKAYLKGWQVDFLAQEGTGNEGEGIEVLTKGRISKYSNLFRLALEKLIFLPYEKSKEIRFQFSLANTGRNLSGNKLIEKADIIHLHWLYQGFLSLKGMEQIFKKKKSVVWTLHDMWTFTGGCHYTGSCDHYKKYCGNCPFLKKPAAEDLSNSNFHKKQDILNRCPGIVFVSCSAWLAGRARESGMLKNHRIEVIPNPIDVDLFSPGNKTVARQMLGINEKKFVILFGSANVNDKRKGFAFLKEALEKLKLKYPGLAEETELLVFGKASSEMPAGYRIYNQNLVENESELVNIYRAADIFVLPSLEDNLPNTIMESMSCGTPVLAFNSGGIPEMVNHKINGYLAESGNSEDLLNGIGWMKEHLNEQLTSAAREKVMKEYHPEKISRKYAELYLSLIK